MSINFNLSCFFYAYRTQKEFSVKNNNGKVIYKLIKLLLFQCKYRKDEQKHDLLNNPQQTDLHAVHGHCGQVVGVLLVPTEAEQRVVLGVLVDDGAVLQVPEVKHADGSIGSYRGKHISTTSCTTERDVIHLHTHIATLILIFSQAVCTYKDAFYRTQTSLSWAISCVFTCPDTRLTRPNTWPVSSPQIVQVVSMLEVPAEWTNMLNCERATKPPCYYLSYSGLLTKQIWINFIPVEGREGGTEVWVLVVVQQTFEACFCVADLRDECKGVW